MGYFLLIIYFYFIHLIFSYKNSDRSRKLEIFFYFLAVFLFIGLRNASVGTDTQGYLWGFSNSVPLTQGFFNEYEDMSLLQFIRYSVTGEGTEIGYTMLVRLLRCFASNGLILLLAEGFIIAVCYGYFFINCVHDPFVGILVYASFGLLSFQLTGIRQSLAMAFCTVAYTLNANGKLKKSLWWIVLGILFHRSAVYFGVAQIGFSLTREMFKRNRILFFIMLTLVGIVMCFFATIILKYTASGIDDFSHYSIEATGNGQIFFAISLIVTFFVAFYQKQALSQYPGDNYHIQNNYAWYILWMGRLVTRTTERVTFFFLPATMIMLGDMTLSIPNRTSRNLVRAAEILLITLLYVYRAQRSTYALWW